MVSKLCGFMVAGKILAHCDHSGTHNISHKNLICYIMQFWFYMRFIWKPMLVILRFHVPIEIKQNLVGTENKCVADISSIYPLNFPKSKIQFSTQFCNLRRTVRIRRLWFTDENAQFCCLSQQWTRHTVYVASCAKDVPVDVSNRTPTSSIFSSIWHVYSVFLKRNLLLETIFFCEKSLPVPKWQFSSEFTTLHVTTVCSSCTAQNHAATTYTQ